MKRKIIGEEFYKLGPKYVSVGTDTALDFRDSLFMQGLKYFPRRFSRAAGAHEHGDGEGSGRRDSTHSAQYHRRKSMHHHRRKSTPETFNAHHHRRSTHHHRRKSAPDGAEHAVNDTGDEELEVQYHRRKSTHHHRRKSTPDGERNSKDSANDSDEFDAHRHKRSSYYRRKSAPTVVGHEIKDTADDNKHKQHYHHRTRSTHHRRKSAPDCVTRKTKDINQIGGDKEKIESRKEDKSKTDLGDKADPKNYMSAIVILSEQAEEADAITISKIEKSDGEDLLISRTEFKPNKQSSVSSNKDKLTKELLFLAYPKSSISQAESKYSESKNIGDKKLSAKKVELKHSKWSKNSSESSDIEKNEHEKLSSKNLKKLSYKTRQAESKHSDISKQSSESEKNLSSSTKSIPQDESDHSERIKC